MHLISPIGAATASALAAVTSTTSVAAQILQNETTAAVKNGKLTRRSSSINLCNGQQQKTKLPSQRSNSAALVFTKPNDINKNKTALKIPNPSFVITSPSKIKKLNGTEFTLMNDENTTTTTRVSDENNEKTAYLTVGNFDEPYSTKNKNPQQNSKSPEEQVFNICYLIKKTF